MQEHLYIDPDGLEQSGRTSYRSADSAEEVRGRLNQVQADAGSYGGATAFVSSLNSANRKHVRGASAASEDRETMGDGDHGAAAYSWDMDSAIVHQIHTANPDQRVTDGF